MNRGIALGLLALLLSGCYERHEFADWTIPLPEGTPVIEYRAVPLAERTARIEVVEDLVIGREPDANHAFNGPFDLSVDATGNIYVADTGNFRIQVFGSDGEYLRTIGRRGEGPGEFARPPNVVTVAGDRVIVPGARNSFREWSLDGRYVGEWVAEPHVNVWDLIGVPGGIFAVYRLDSPTWQTEYRRETRLAMLSQGQTAPRVFHDQMDPPRPLHEDPRTGRVRPPSILLGSYGPLHAVTPAGDVYISPGDEYQVVAWTTAPAPDWALRASWAREEVSADQVDRARERLRASRPPGREVLDHDVGILGPNPALAGISVDGRGRLFVFPRVAQDDRGHERPVDVYAADGERILSGLIPVRQGIVRDLGTVEPIGWAASHGDHVYAIGIDEASAEQVVYRYRLVLPAGAER